MKSNYICFTSAVLLATLVGCFACSNGGSKSTKDENADPNGANSNAQMSPIPSLQPTSLALPSALPSTSPYGNVPKCSDVIFKSQEALACTTLYVFSSKTCVVGVTKQASCTRDDINKIYGNATFNGQPLMAQVDQWIANGFQPNQCAIGVADQKLYVYFLKQTSTTKEASADHQAHFQFEEKTLGPSGAILNSIKLDTNSSATSLNCAN